METRLALSLCLVFAATTAMAVQRPYLRDAGMIEKLREGRTDEARAQVREKWARYLALGDEELWSLPPGPMVYRAMGVNETEGCPSCGTAAYDKGGLWPFKCDIVDAPWQVACPSCGAVFPSNDFAGFYESGLDALGYFIPEQADRSLLVNAARPGADDPLRGWAVDDGTGWVYHDGQRFWFIARYCGHLWIQLTKDAQAMAEDYQRTGEPAVAHAAALLLAAYDDLWESIGRDAALVEFLTRKGVQIGHPEWAGAADAVRRHIESELIAEGARDVMRTRAAGSTRRAPESVTGDWEDLGIGHGLPTRALWP